MMNDEKVDLSSLDPTMDQQRWDRLVGSIADRAWSARKRRLTVPLQLVTWARPVLAVAACLALVPWGASLLRNGESEQPSASQQDPAYLLARWAAEDEKPSPSEILRLLGDSHEDR